MRKARLAVLISGRGSHLKKLIEWTQKPFYPAKIKLVISDNADAPGLQYARDAGIQMVSTSPYPGKKEFAKITHETLIEKEIDLMILAGFMRVLHTDLVNNWSHRILNIHPSLLPKFPGLHPQRQAIDAGVKTSGCTIHWVVPEVDSGPIIAQAEVPVYKFDTETLLAERILKQEHILYPVVIMSMANELLNKINGTI